MIVLEAMKYDLGAILEMQYLAYQSEAKLLNNSKISPLVQTLSEVESEYEKGVILKGVTEDGTIIGSVRGYTEGNTLHIGKLIVHPDMQGKGYGKQLLSSIEDLYPDHRYELFTSSKSTRNLGLYESRGYVRFREKEAGPGLKMIYLEKYGKENALAI
jgi:GNAT superfamily N-acetyltransferase